MKETQLTKLIDELNFQWVSPNETKWIKPNEGKGEEYWNGFRYALELAKQHAISLLPEEREDMEQLFEKGIDEGFHRKQYEDEEFVLHTGSDTYFNRNFTQYKP